MEWRPQLEFTPAAIARAYIRVIEVGDEVTAVAALTRPDGPVAEIDHLWVLPEHHGRGQGRRLVNDLLGRAWDDGYAAVRVVADPGARAFYERLGAQYEAEVPADVCGTPRTLPVLMFRRTH